MLTGNINILKTQQMRDDRTQTKSKNYKNPLPTNVWIPGLIFVSPQRSPVDVMLAHGGEVTSQQLRVESTLNISIISSREKKKNIHQK